MKMSPLCQLDGVTGRQPTVVTAVAVPHSDEVRNGVRVGLLHASRDDAGIDVSLESVSICIVDASGRIVREVKVASEPEVLIRFFGGLGLLWHGSDWRPDRCRNGCMQACGMLGCRSNCSRPGT
jgi:hypothetical protein